MIKDIVVHLDGSASDEIRLTYGEGIASTFDAHLTGVFAAVRPEIVAVPEAYIASNLAELQGEVEQQTKEAESRLRDRFRRLGIPNDLERIDVYWTEAGGTLASHARTADWFIASRPDQFLDGSLYAESVLFQSGRACLFVPPEGKPPQDYKTVLVAWKDTREAARAVAEAMPVLQKAQQVIVALVEEYASEQFGNEPGAAIGRHLSRHGVKAEIRTVSGWSDVGKALLNEAERCRADLIVAGGYGHSRFREWVMGGATRTLLAEANVPLLMAR